MSKLYSVRPDEITAFCQELVRCQSLSGEEKPAAEAVANKMHTLGYDQIYQDDYGSTIGVLNGHRPGRTVVFDAHLDIVPVDTPELWTPPPFGGYFDGTRIWGRGACDAKGCLAAFVCALGHLPRDRYAGKIVISASVGEEMIEGLALSELVREHSPDFVVIGAPTNFCIATGHKGRAGLQVTTTGVAAHTSQPEQGANAVYRMMDAVERIRAIALPDDDRLGSGVNALIEIISSPYPGTSMVPSGCQARFDRRLVRGETKDSVLADMRRAVSDLNGVRVHFHQVHLTCYTALSVQTDDFHPAWAVSTQSEIVRKAEQGLRTVEIGPQLCTLPYSTNAVASAGESGIPTMIFGPSCIQQARAVDEFVEVDQLVRGAEAFAAIASALLQSE